MQHSASTIYLILKSPFSPQDESEEEEDIRAEYRSLIAIHAGKLKGGMDNWFSDDTDRVRRVSLSEQEPENAVRTHATDIVRYV